MKTSFKALRGKSIVGNLGSIIGNVDDIVIDEKTGRLISLSVELSDQSPIPPTEGNDTLLHYRTVTSVKDVIVVDESKIIR